MIRALGKKIDKIIIDKVPDPLKLVFFFSLAFYAGYFIGDIGYENYEDIIEVVCEP